MQENVSKFHVLINNDQKEHVSIGTTQINDSKSEKVLWVNIANKLHFENHIKIICGKTQEKINALKRVAPIVNLEKRNLTNSQFKYCSLT